MPTRHHDATERSSLKRFAFSTATWALSRELQNLFLHLLKGLVVNDKNINRSRQQAHLAAPRNKIWVLYFPFSRDVLKRRKELGLLLQDTFLASTNGDPKFNRRCAFPRGQAMLSSDELRATFPCHWKRLHLKWSEGTFCGNTLWDWILATFLLLFSIMTAFDQLVVADLFLHAFAALNAPTSFLKGCVPIFLHSIFNSKVCQSEIWWFHCLFTSGRRSCLRAALGEVPNLPGWCPAATEPGCPNCLVFLGGIWSKMTVITFCFSALTQEEEAMQSPSQMKNKTAKEIFVLCKIRNMK